MRIDCNTAESYMTDIFAENYTRKQLHQVKKHCEKCELCRVKFYNLGQTEIDLTEDELEYLLELNRGIYLKKRFRKRLIIILSSIFTVLAIVGLFYALIMAGRLTFFASVDYGVSSGYTESTKTHPSYDDVSESISLCKDYFSQIGKGSILLSLAYNDDLTYSEGYENCIIIDFSYYRMFAVKFSSGKSNFTRSDLSFVIAKDGDDFEIKGYIKTKGVVTSG